MKSSNIDLERWLSHQKPIDYGRRSKIYLLGGERILKLYNPGFSQKEVVREFDNCVAIYNSKVLRVPKAISLVYINGQIGIEYERVEGISLMNLFQKNPLLYFTYTDKIASVHKSIHGVKVDGVVSQEEFFGDIISLSTRLNGNEKLVLNRILNKKGLRVLCHGDFHHGNLILNEKGEVYITDWMDAFVGNPWLDVALTAVNAAVSTAPAHVPWIYRQLYEILKKVARLDKRYMKAYGVEDNLEMKEQIALAAGIHLTRNKESNIQNHNEYLKKAISQLTS